MSNAEAEHQSVTHVHCVVYVDTQDAVTPNNFEVYCMRSLIYDLSKRFHTYLVECSTRTVPMRTLLRHSMLQALLNNKRGLPSADDDRAPFLGIISHAAAG